MPSRQFLIQQACLTETKNFYPAISARDGARNIEIGFREGWWYVPRFIVNVRYEYRRLVQIHGEGPDAT